MTMFYRTKNRKIYKEHEFYHLQENIKNNYWIQDFNFLKTASKKVVHKVGKFLGSKIADTATKSNDDKIGTIRAGII